MSPLVHLPWRAFPSWLIGNRLRIWMLHSISNDSHDPFSIPVKDFQRAMEKIANRGMQVISLPQGLELLKGKQALGKKIILTFDDGYQDFIQNALPTLDKFSFTSTLFIPTGHVGKKAAWHTYNPKKQLLDWDGIQEAHRRGVTIASHTVSHPHLTSLSQAELEFELRFSLDTLRSKLGEVFPALAYPGGEYGPRERLAACQAGYNCAVGTSSRWGNGPETDVFALRREVPKEKTNHG